MIKIFFNRLFSGVVKKHLLLTILAFLVALGFALYSNEYVTQVLSAFVGFVVGKALISLSITIYYSREDQRKAIRDYDSLASFYDEKLYGNKYILFPKNKKIKFFYDELYVHYPNNTLKIIDDPKKRFVLPNVILPYYADLMQAHKASFTKNALTIRLDDLKPTEQGATIYTSRTTYFDHLVLNRAIDYPVKDVLSVRRLFEYNNQLTPLKKSQLANQIGVNAIILFNDGYTIFPRRSFTATVAKNRITSSLAIRLNTIDPFSKLTDQLIKKDFIEQMKCRLHFPDSYFADESRIEVVLLGIGRDLVEGGKPQFYYVIHMHDLSSNDYTIKLNDCIKQKRKDRLTQIDYDRKLYITKFSNLDISTDGTFKFKTRLYNKKKKAFYEKKSFIRVKSELSFIYNLWHYYILNNPSRVQIFNEIDKN
jgi:hypothetical protein